MRNSNVELSRLGFYEEAVGILHELSEEEGILIARISKIALALPSEMADKLRQLLGRRIGILRTDIPQKEYLVRVLDEIYPITYNVELNAHASEVAIA